jgi:hypothetical protein
MEFYSTYSEIKSDVNIQSSQADVNEKLPCKCSSSTIQSPTTDTAMLGRQYLLTMHVTCKVYINYIHIKYKLLVKFNTICYM